MSAVLQPETAEQALEAVQGAVAEARPLEVVGRASKRGLGRPIENATRLALDRLSGISLYEPEELVLSAGPGTVLSEIEALLAQRRQQLVFEPPDFGPLLGGDNGQGTLGGLLACNLAGPRRIKAGAARDHFLGFKAISGRGEAFKSGGRVVKNVTGYDLSKLLAGSYGTLAAFTDLTVKVLPAPEKTRTVLVYGLADDAAMTAMATAAGGASEPTALAHLPGDVARQSAVTYVAGAGGAVTAMRLEGPGPSVSHRCAALRTMMGEYGDTEELHGHNSETFWREIRDVTYFVAGSNQVWRLSVAPAQGAAVIGRIRQELDCRFFYDWAGGLIWLALAARADAGADIIRRSVAVTGGHATLVRADAAIRATVPPFHPPPAAVAALSARIKASFDPLGLLNPGRMTAADLPPAGEAG